MWHYDNLDDELIGGMECETCGYAHNPESNKQYLKMLARTNYTVLRLSHYENAPLSPREFTIFTGGIIHIANDTPPNMEATVTGSYIKEKTEKTREVALALLGGSIIEGATLKAGGGIIVALGGAVCLTGYVAGACMGELIGFCVACVGVVGMCRLRVLSLCKGFRGVVVRSVSGVCSTLCLFAVAG